jgi:hypothetical protein
MWRSPRQTEQWQQRAFNEILDKRRQGSSRSLDVDVGVRHQQRRLDGAKSSTPTKLATMPRPELRSPPLRLAPSQCVAQISAQAYASRPGVHGYASRTLPLGLVGRASPAQECRAPSLRARAGGVRGRRCQQAARMMHPECEWGHDTICGATAGQTIILCHVHLMPCRSS